MVTDAGPTICHGMAPACCQEGRFITQVRHAQPEERSKPSCNVQNLDTQQLALERVPGLFEGIMEACKYRNAKFGTHQVPINSPGRGSNKQLLIAVGGRSRRACTPVLGAPKEEEADSPRLSLLLREISSCGC